MEILMFLVRIYLVSSVLVAASSSGLDLLSPSSSPPPPLPETSKGFGEVPISSPESHKPGNAPPPKASLPSSPPLADVAAPPPSYSSGTKAPNREPIVSVPSAPGPVSSPVSDIPPFPSVALPQPTPSIVPPRNASNKKPVAPVASPPTISVDISPPVIPKLPHSRSPAVPTSSPTRTSPTTLPAFPIESPAGDNRSHVAAPSNETAKPLPTLPHKDSPTSTAPSPPKFNGHSHHTSSSPPLNHLHHQEPKKIKDSPPPPPPKMSNRPISSSMHPISIAPSPSPTQGLLPPLLKLFPTTHRQNLIAKLSFISPKAFPLRSSSKPLKTPTSSSTPSSSP
uniref:Uncharacterized protein n=1 Tax=Brassica campestris TaxID=3711 RepID=A0A3P6AN37_BRACM|nr:unnamed protein product [Brassica rapa]